MLVNRGASLLETAGALEALARFLTDSAMRGENPTEGRRRFIVGDVSLTGNELNRDSHPGAEAVGDAWEAPIPVERHDRIIVDGVQINGALLAALVTGGRTLRFTREGDTVNIEDLTGREGDA